MRSIRRLALFSSASASALMVDRDWGLRRWLKQPLFNLREQLLNNGPSDWAWTDEEVAVFKRINPFLSRNPRRQGSSGRVPSPGLTGVEGS